MRNALLPLLLLLVGLAAGQDNLSPRIDALLARWATGDAAARTGVVAEATALGDGAIAELFCSDGRRDRATSPCASRAYACPRRPTSRASGRS